MCAIMRAVFRGAAGFIVCLAGAAGQDASVDSRTKQIESARELKAQTLHPDETTRADRLVSRGSAFVLDSLSYGIKGLALRFGGLPTGQGFAVGPQYTRYGLGGGRVVVRGSAAGSMAGAVLIDLQASVPRIGRGLFADFLARYGAYPRMDYYGPGPDSSKAGRSQYRLEENRYEGFMGVRFVKHLYTGAGGGYSRFNVGRGNRAGIAQAADLYTEELSPGIQRQTGYWSSGGFLRLDYRDDPIGARSGGMVHAQFRYYGDTKAELFSFRQLQLEARQYLPMFNRRRVIAFTAAATMSFRNGAGLVPFYLQPTLGGSDDLRGFRSYRFHDDNVLLASAEYRWEAFSGLDMALFFDAGKVTPKRSQLNFHSLESSAGFGFRFNARNRNFLRIDTGFSHEGFQVWVKFGTPPPVRFRELAMSGGL